MVGTIGDQRCRARKFSERIDANHERPKMSRDGKLRVSNPLEKLFDVNELGARERARLKNEDA